MKGLTEPMLEMESYRQILEGIEQGRTPVFATGVIDAAKATSCSACGNISIVHCWC